MSATRWVVNAEYWDAVDVLDDIKRSILEDERDIDPKRKASRTSMVAVFGEVAVHAMNPSAAWVTTNDELAELTGFSRRAVQRATSALAFQGHMVALDGTAGGRRGDRGIGTRWHLPALYRAMYPSRPPLAKDDASVALDPSYHDGNDALGRRNTRPTTTPPSPTERSEGSKRLAPSAGAPGAAAAGMAQLDARNDDTLLPGQHQHLVDSIAPDILAVEACEHDPVDDWGDGACRRALSKELNSLSLWANTKVWGLEVGGERFKNRPAVECLLTIGETAKAWREKCEGKG